MEKITWEVLTEKTDTYFTDLLHLTIWRTVLGEASFVQRPYERSQANSEKNFINCNKDRALSWRYGLASLIIFVNLKGPSKKGGRNVEWPRTPKGDLRPWRSTRFEEENHWRWLMWNLVMRIHQDFSFACEKRGVPLRFCMPSTNWCCH